MLTISSMLPPGAKVRIRIERTPTTNALLAERIDLRLAEHAQAEVFEVVPAHESALTLRHVRATLGSQAHLAWLSLDAGQKLARTSLDVLLQGESAGTQIRGISLLNGKSQSHRRIQVFHEAPHCHSDQFVRHMLQGTSQASCASQVEILRGVKDSKAHQLINSLLLSRETKASAKPTLLIHNDAVEASHGTTCGELDAAQLFYLKSRGLSDAEARRLLVTAFVLGMTDHAEFQSLSKTLLAQRFQ